MPKFGRDALPEHLKDRPHEDYFWPFSKIPRAWTSVQWDSDPVLLWGNQKNFENTRFWHDLSVLWVEPSKWVDGGKIPLLAPSAVPNPLLSKWKISWGVYGCRLWWWMPVIPIGFAISWKMGRRRGHFRFAPLGRWDTVDQYSTVPSFELSFKVRYES